MYSRPVLSMVTNVLKSGEKWMYLPKVLFSKYRFCSFPVIDHHFVWGGRKEARETEREIG